MLDFIKSKDFWKKPWYLELIDNERHIDYKKIGFIYWTCKGCLCSDLVASYQCFILLINEKWKNILYE
jgi:hypothetical protein